MAEELSSRFHRSLLQLDQKQMSTAAIRIIAAILALIILVVIIWRARARRPPV